MSAVRQLRSAAADSSAAVAGSSENDRSASGLPGPATSAAGNRSRSIPADRRALPAVSAQLSTSRGDALLPISSSVAVGGRSRSERYCPPLLLGGDQRR